MYFAIKSSEGRKFAVKSSEGYYLQLKAVRITPFIATASSEGHYLQSSGSTCQRCYSRGTDPRRTRTSEFNGAPHPDLHKIRSAARQIRACGVQMWACGTPNPGLWHCSMKSFTFSYYSVQTQQTGRASNKEDPSGERVIQNLFGNQIAVTFQ